MIVILAAFQFLSIMPPVVRRAFTAKELGQSVGYYPLVGLILGGIFYGCYTLGTQIMPTTLAAIMILVLWIVLTRGLHFDGFLDTCDGLFGAFTPQKRLEIMHDSRVGAFGVAGGILLMLIKFSALSNLQIDTAGLILVPVLGRFMITQAIVLYPYGRKDGLGKDIKANAHYKELIIASLITGLTAWFSLGWLGFITIGITFIAGHLWLRFVLQRIPGLTGDIYGATCETTETLILTLMATTIF